MKPETNARRILSITRSKAKMYEYKVPEESHIQLPLDPNVLFSLAIGMLGDGAAEMAATFIEIGPTDQVSAPQLTQSAAWDAGDNTIRDTSRESLRFAAAYFDAYLEARLNSSLTADFSLLCASGYELSGSIGSARVVAMRTKEPALTLANTLALLVHRLLTGRYSLVPEGYLYSNISNHLLRELKLYLDGSGSEDVLREVSAELRLITYREGEAKELLYGDLAIAIVSRHMTNSSRRRLPPASGLSLDHWQAALSKISFPRQLWPAQQRICDAGLLIGRSAVIQLPTSAGKTRATELIIRSSFLSGRTSLAVIVAPFRSLCHEIRSDLNAAFSGEAVSINEATDTFDFDLDLDDIFSRKSVLILTPEKLLYILRRDPSFSKEIGLIIYDEGHQFDGISRGPTYELLLTSLKIALKADTQVVFISAVIGNAPEIAGWLVGDESAVVDSTGLTPTPKSIAFSSWQDLRGKLEYVSPSDPDESEFYVPRIIEALSLKLLGKERKSRNFPVKTGADIGLFLGIQLAPNGSSAVFCGRKDSASSLCERVVEIFEREVRLEKPRNVSDAHELDKIAYLIRENLGPNAKSATSAEIGVLQHHGNVPHGLRVSVEHAMKEGLAKIVVCTSTLAQGINFPIKYLVVTTVHQGQERILVRDFQNLIGRAGRAGMHTEGSVIFASPDIYDERRSQNPWRWRAAKELMNPANSEPCSSAILKVLVPYVQEQPPISLGLTPELSQFLVFASSDSIEALIAAALKSNPGLDCRRYEQFLGERARVIQSIAAYLIAHETPDSGGDTRDVDRLVSSTLANTITDSRGRETLKILFRAVFAAINEHASSVDRKALIRKSPLPPAAVIALEIWLAANIEPLQEAVSSDELAFFAEEVILRFVSAKIAKNIVDKAAISIAYRMWILGKSFGSIYEALAARRVKVGSSHIKPDDVVALCEGAFGFEASMIAASLSDLSEEVDEDTRKAFSRLQRSLRYGLNQPAEIALYEAGFSDRVIVQILVEKFNGVTSRAGVKAVCRTRRNDVEAVLGPFPSHYRKVLAELAQ